MFTIVRKSAAGVVAVAALGLGGSAIADAASNSSSATKTASSHARPAPQTLSSDVAAKVKAAALEKVPGATVLRTSSGRYASAYHAHIKTSDGTKQVVLVDNSFTATAVQADQGGVGGPGNRKPETALTGDTKSKVEAAVLAKYPGATIVRTESDTDGSAPYEAHVTTKDNKELEVEVSKAFEVVAAKEHGARP